MAKRNSIVLPLLLVLLLCGTVAIALFFLGKPAEPAAPTSAHATEPSPKTTPAVAELARPAQRPAPVPSAELPKQTEERREADEKELADAIWVSGRVVFPPDVPLGEVVHVVADGKEFDHRDLHKAEVQGDGTFRVAFSAKTKSGRLLVDAPHLYLESPKTLRMTRLPDEIVLEPRLGGRIVGVVRTPDLTSDERARVREKKVQYQGWTRNGGDFTTVGRTGSLDENMAFELRGVPTLDQAALTFDPEFLSMCEMENIAVEPGKTRDVELVITRGAEVSGTLLDEQGKTVEGVQLRAVYKIQRSTYYRNAQRVANLGKDGSFTIRGIPPGDVELLAERQGWTDLRLELGELADGDVKGPFRMVMQKGGIVRGSVKWPDGRAVSGAHIVVSGGEGVDGQSRIDTSVAESDSEGRFEVSGLTKGPYRLEATARPDWDTNAEETGLDPAELRAAKREAKRQPPWRAVAEDLEPGAELALTLTSGLGVEGDVVDDTGVRLDRFAVSATPGEGEPWLAQRQRINRVFRDTGGTFRLEGLLPGTWSIKASAIDHDDSEEIIVKLPEDSERRLTLTVGRAATLGGVVLRPDGTPAARAKVEAEPENGYWYSNRARGATCDGEGRFTLERVPLGSVQVRATFDGFAPSDKLTLDLAAADARSDLRLVLRVGGTITGELLAKAGASVAYRPIQVSYSNEGFWEQTTTDANGHFEQRFLAPGKYEVSAPPAADELESLVDEEGEMDWALHEAASVKAMVEVADGAVVHVLLGAPPEDPLRVSGVVRRAGKPFEGAVVSAWGQDRSNAAARSDANGNYELLLEGPGTYHMTAQAKGAAQVSKQAEVQADVVLDFDLGSGRIAGVVQGPDGPVPNINLSVHQERSEGGTTYAYDVSDEHGEFSLEGLGAGTYTIETNPRYWGNDQHDEWAPASVRGLELAEGGNLEGVVLRLERGGTLDGLVTGPDGTPVVGATVWCRSLEGEDATPVQTDGIGRFRCASLKPGSWTARAEHEGLVSGDSAPVTITSGGEADVELVLRAGTTLVVFVEGGDGKLTQAMVNVKDAHGRSERTWRYGNDPNANYTAESGFRVGPLPLGDYEVEASNKDGYRGKTTVRVRGEPELSVKLKLEKPEK